MRMLMMAMLVLVWLIERMVRKEIRVRRSMGSKGNRGVRKRQEE